MSKFVSEFYMQICLSKKQPATHQFCCNCWSNRCRSSLLGNSDRSGQEAVLGELGLNVSHRLFSACDSSSEECVESSSAQVRRRSAGHLQTKSKRLPSLSVFLVIQTPPQSYAWQWVIITFANNCMTNEYGSRASQGPGEGVVAQK